VHAFGTCTVPLSRNAFTTQMHCPIAPPCRNPCSPGRRDLLLRRGPWGFSPCVWCHHEERSEAGSPMGAGSAPVGVQARDLLLPFRVGFCLKRSAGAFSPASWLWARVARPFAVHRCACPPDRHSERAVGRAIAPERSYGARGAYSAAEALRRIPPRLCSSLFGEGSCRRPSLPRAEVMDIKSSRALNKGDTAPQRHRSNV
jgi:hypothetical protein